MAELELPQPDEFLENQAFLRRLAASLVRDGAGADDLVQDTWAAWAERAPHGLSSPRAWLARVLRNRAANLEREAARRARRERESARAERIDPGAETGALLEIQARVVAALRALEEPYRSTLVLRYYHDLGPQAIAQRTGSSLHTVKARLVRGLEKLRHELDRRSGGERGTWCHWLFPLVRDPGPALPVPAAPRPSPAARSLPPALTSVASAPGRLALGSWIAGVAFLAGVIVCVVLLQRPRAPLQTASVAAERTPALARMDEPSRRVPMAVEGAGSAVDPVAEPGRPEEPLMPKWFEWRQYARNSSHDNGWETDRIRRPRLSWHVEGCRGQPTVSGRDLYSGGDALLRIDPASGVVLARALEEGLAPDVTPAVAPAPAIASERVIARRVQDGSVWAFDRALERELWHFLPERPGFDRGSGCLVDDETFVFAHGTEVIALRVFDGAVVWRFWTDEAGTVDMIPAAFGGVAYFGAENGAFLAVEMRSGRELWRTETGGRLGGSSPVVVSGAIVFADRGATQSEVVEPGGADEQRRGQIWSLACSDGRVLWKRNLDADAFSTPAVGRGGKRKGFFVAVGLGAEVACLDLKTGEIERRLPTGRNPFGSPTVLDDTLAVGTHDGELAMYELDSDELRWAFRLPSGVQVHDFVHAGDRIYASTTAGLFCLGDDARGRPARRGFVLEWKPAKTPRERR